ncbi:MAG TPA: DUF6580 family putative transport protein [Dehalococcoidia bacterium]|nr:DUF6580 family putative transport protein [Dehalococcoidia bacterium]
MTRAETGLTIATLLVVGVLSRLLPHAPNFAPVTAIGLFSGAYMPRRYSLLTPLVVMLTSDYLLLYLNPFGAVRLDRLYAPWDLYHETLPYIYASLCISALVGWLLARELRVLSITTGALFCSIQFFLITNAAVWIEGAYDRGLNGLWQSYVAGIPFFKGTLAGDLVYTAVFFGLYEFVRKKHVAREALRQAHITANSP